MSIILRHQFPWYFLTEISDKIKSIVITGGPCSGKTTGLARLCQFLTDRGYKVLISPESATKLILAGMKPGELPWGTFQEEIFQDILHQEERLMAIAHHYVKLGHKVVILHDRGLLDGEAYVGPEEFSSMLERFGFNYNDISNQRYHAVMHLRTAALGAESFYTLDNNSARIETVEQARALDQRTLDAWTRHQHPRVIDNSTDFEGKLRRLFAEICALLGDPVPLEIEKRYLVEDFNSLSIVMNRTGHVESTIVQDYLLSPDPKEQRRIRVRSDGTSSVYYLTYKRKVGPGVRAEEEKLITAREYTALYTLRDPSKHTIKKRRHCFFWKEQFIEIDVFEEPEAGLVIMEVEQTDQTLTPELPPFIKVMREITDDAWYSNYAIASRAT